jgi:hypothetical protein
VVVSDDGASDTDCTDVANAIQGRILSVEDAAMPNKWAIWFGLPRPFP